MNKVKDPSESDAMGQPTQQSMEPRRLSSELLALDPSQPFHGHSFKENYEESPETADEEVLVETNYGDGTRVPTFSLVRPGIDRADVADLLEKEMPHVTGSWFLKAGEQKVLSFRSLKLVITHDSKNTMMQVHSTGPKLPTPLVTIQLVSLSHVIQLTSPEPKQIHGRPYCQYSESLAEELRSP